MASSIVFPAAGAFDLLPAFAEPIPVTLIAELLGVPAEDAPRLLDWSHRMVAMYRLDRNRATEDAAVAATLEFSAYLRSAVARRRVRPEDDLLSLLTAAASDGETLSEDEIISNAVLLLNAGHEATVHAIGNAVAAILESGIDSETLFATPDRTAATIEETLRFDPPLHLFTRYALEPVALHGVELAVGDRIGLLIGAANRDAAVFPACGTLRPSPVPGPACRVRGRHPLLSRSTSGPARTAGRAADPLRPPSRPTPRRTTAVRRSLPLPRVAGPAGRRLTLEPTTPALRR